MILVTGATGRVGYRLMEALADLRADATAMVRVAAKASDLPGTGRHIVATLDDPPSAEVLRQFDRIFLLSPEIEEQAALERVFIDAVAAAGHRPHIVKVCADGFQDPACEVRYMLSHRQVAYHLDAKGLPVTYLAAATYMDDLLGEAEEIQRTGEIRAAAGHGRAGFIATTDVAAAAARVLTGDGHDGDTYVLTGPEALGYSADRRPASAPSSASGWSTPTYRPTGSATCCSSAGAARGRRTATSSGSSGSGRAAART